MDSPPKARALGVITNAAEPRLDSRFTFQLIDAWRRWGADVSTYEFPESDHLPRDMIDPGNEEQNTKLSHPVVTRFHLGRN
jgi:hypothetical protein